MFTYFARQPILRADKTLYGYEILFRDSEKNVFPGEGAEAATQRLINESFLGQGLDALAPESLCFVNFPRDSLIGELPTLLPPKRLVVEVLEDIEPEPEIFETLQLLHQQGYTIALDDYRHNLKWLEILDVIDIIKFDFKAQSIDELRSYLDAFQDSKVTFLAEKIESHEEFEEALSLGFTLFQGYFFSKPEMLKQRALSSSQLTLIKLLKAVNSQQVDLREIEELVSVDINLSYKLFRLANSKVGHRGRELNSLKQAVVYLGEKELRKFVSIVVTQAISGTTPASLTSMAMARAYYCELLTAESPVDGDDQAFLVGLFSLLDVMLERPMSQLIDDLPISEATKTALLFQTGRAGLLLKLCQAHEAARWHEIESLAGELGSSPTDSFTCFHKALNLADETLKLVS